MQAKAGGEKVLWATADVDAKFPAPRGWTCCGTGHPMPVVTYGNVQVVQASETMRWTAHMWVSAKTAQAERNSARQLQQRLQRIQVRTSRLLCLARC